MTPADLTIHNPRPEDEPGGAIASAFGAVYERLQRRYFFRDPSNPRHLVSRRITPKRKRAGIPQGEPEDIFQDAVLFAWVEFRRMSGYDRRHYRNRPWILPDHLEPLITQYIEWERALERTPDYDISPYDPDGGAGITNPSPILRDALSRLPPSLRHTAELRFIDGCRYREIAQQCGLSTGAVSRYLYEAKKRLRKNQKLAARKRRII